MKNIDIPLREMFNPIIEKYFSKSSYIKFEENDYTDRKHFFKKFMLASRTLDTNKKIEIAIELIKKTSSPEGKRVLRDFESPIDTFDAGIPAKIAILVDSSHGTIKKLRKLIEYGVSIDTSSKVSIDGLYKKTFKKETNEKETQKPEEPKINLDQVAKETAKNKKPSLIKTNQEKSEITIDKKYYEEKIKDFIQAISDRLNSNVIPEYFYLREKNYSSNLINLLNKEFTEYLITIKEFEKAAIKEKPKLKMKLLNKVEILCHLLFLDYLYLYSTETEQKINTDLFEKIVAEEITKRINSSTSKSHLVEKLTQKYHQNLIQTLTQIERKNRSEK